MTVKKYKITLTNDADVRAWHKTNGCAYIIACIYTTDLV